MRDNIINIRTLRSTLLGLIFILLIYGPAYGQPVNDIPCNAIDLVISRECNYSQFTNLDATASGLPLTQCMAYSGGDVWFKVTVPYSGGLTIELSSEATMQFPDNNGWIYRPGLAVYHGECNSLVFDTCWIDTVLESPPRKPKIVLENQVAGSTLWLRVWEYANNDNGIFRICTFDHVTGIPSDIFIPEAFSPNNDGMNDYFVIDGITDYPDNKFSVYNIWGHKVYEMTQYDNNWDGTSNRKGSSGTKLPGGTYYYVLSLDKLNMMKGSVFIKRD